MSAQEKISVKIPQLASLTRNDMTLEISHFRALELQLQLIGDQGDEFRVRRLALRVCVGNSSTNIINRATTRFNEAPTSE
jgi:hypothetical protein